jgi:hypothetical protein
MFTLTQSSASQVRNLNILVLQKSLSEYMGKVPDLELKDCDSSTVTHQLYDHT